MDPRWFEKSLVDKRVLIGFDGFTDTLLAPVAKREEAGSFTPFASIRDFGERILAAAGQSANIELVTKRTKLGGNCPILANALLEVEIPLSFVGLIGEVGRVEPLFADLAARAEAVTLGPSAHTDAFEFPDGKLMFGKLGALDAITYENLLEKVGPERWLRWFEEADLFISANWTMILAMNDIWRRIKDEVGPHLTPKRRLMFVDLADPSKRSDAALVEALELLRELGAFFGVHLGLNVAEAERVANVLNIKDDSIEALFEAAGLERIVIHTAKEATACDAAGRARVETDFCPHPKITTGAGDNFNAGYCHGLLRDLSAEDALLLGVTSAGYYIRHGRSPRLSDLV